MGDVLKEKEKELEKVKIEDEIEGYKASRAKKKAIEKKMKKEYGRDWKKVLGFAGNLLDPETKQSLYSVNPGLRDLSGTKGLRKL